MIGKNSQLFEKLVSVARVTKVVKGGRRFGFSVLMVVGDRKGMVGIGKGKAKEVFEAKEKALKLAKKNMIRIAIKDNRTLYHDVSFKYKASKIAMRMAQSGTGVKAGGAARFVCEAVGLKDVVAKSLGSTNVYNLTKAVLGALKTVKSPKMIAAKRSKKVIDLDAYKTD